uniref:Uncharacterized protein n=1 Tax=Lepeophtheirus salmonis TaxID=72036 RepID=A0A0K2VJL0_LEPSM
MYIHCRDDLLPSRSVTMTSNSMVNNCCVLTKERRHKLIYRWRDPG